MLRSHMHALIKTQSSDPLEDKLKAGCVFFCVLVNQSSLDPDYSALHVLKLSTWCCFAIFLLNPTHENAETSRAALSATNYLKSSSFFLSNYNIISTSTASNLMANIQ